MRHRIRYEVIFGQQQLSSAIFLFIDELGLEFFRGLTDFVFEETFYNTLPNTNTIDFDSTTDSFEIGRGAALFFVQGEENIFGLGSIAPSRFSFFPNRQALPTIFDFFNAPPNNTFYPEFPNLETRPFLVRNKIQQLLNLLDQKLIESNPNISNITERKITFINFLDEPFSSVEAQFRVEYKPFVETDIRSFLPYNDADSNKEVVSQQFFNQESNVVSINSLEELHQRVVNRGRGSTEILTYLDRTFDNIPELGTKVDDFVLSSAQHTVNRTSITSDYNFDEFFAKLNRFTAVLEEYRQFSVPNENLVNRQYNREIFGKFTRTPVSSQTSISGIDTSDYLDTKQIGAILFQPTGGTRQTLPAITTPFNNQIKIETKMATNVKSADKSTEILDENQNVDPNKRKNEPVIYTDFDSKGRATGFVQNLNVRLVEQFFGAQVGNLI